MSHQSSIVVADTSVLINFLVLDHVPLLASLPGRTFLITDHVRSEVTEHNPEQFSRLNQALASGHLQEISVTDPAEVALFAAITKTGLGIGECSAIAVAEHRHHTLAMEDRIARKRVARDYPTIPILMTESLMTELIRAALLDVEQADAMKTLWEVHYRFKLNFSTFADIL